MCESGTHETEGIFGIIAKAFSVRVEKVGFTSKKEYQNHFGKPLGSLGVGIHTCRNRHKWSSGSRVSYFMSGV